jgi:hypothetical protein
MPVARSILGGLCLMGLLAVAAPGTAKSKQPVPEGTVVVLNQQIQTDPGSARAYIQFGKPVAERDVRDYYPVCYFYLNTVEPGQPQTIAPGEFPVARSSWDTRQDFGQGPANFAVASLRLDLVQIELNEFYRTKFELAASSRPEMSELICMVHYGPGTVMRYFLKLEEIRKTLGDVVTLRLP